MVEFTADICKFNIDNFDLMLFSANDKLIN